MRCCARACTSSSSSGCSVMERSRCPWRTTCSFRGDRQCSLLGQTAHTSTGQRYWCTGIFRPRQSCWRVVGVTVWPAGQVRAPVCSSKVKSFLVKPCPHIGCDYAALGVSGRASSAIALSGEGMGRVQDRVRRGRFYSRVAIGGSFALGWRVGGHGGVGALRREWVSVFRV